MELFLSKRAQVGIRFECWMQYLKEYFIRCRKYGHGLAKINLGCELLKGD